MYYGEDEDDKDEKSSQKKNHPKTQEEQEKEFVITLAKSIFIAGAIIIAIIIMFINVYTVKTGEVAIVSTFGKLSEIQGEGLNYKIPFIQSKYIMEIRERTYIFGKTDEMDTTIEVSTKDIQSIKLEFTVQASITNAEKLYRAFSSKYEYRFIRPRVIEIVQANIAKYTVEEFVSKRAEISNLIFKNLKDDFKQYGISVSNVSLVNHDFSDEYEKAIESKKVAEQAVERAKAEQEKLKVEAENQVKLAEYKLKEKELQAKANAIESNSLSPQLLRKLALEKWDGHLPKVTNGGNNLITLD